MPTCPKCQSSFEITPDDLVFYDQISPTFKGKKYQISLPTLCPECRLLRKQIWRNEFQYYNRQCDSCHKKILSLYPQDAIFPVYCHKCWWGESWNPLDLGRDFDFNQPFFAQFDTLQNQVPKLSMVNDNGVNSENCEYCYDFAFGKNCYLVSTAWYGENCSYARYGGKLKYVCDCSLSWGSELTYECANIIQAYNCIFLEDSSNCDNCYFGIDLKGCSNCFCCFKLRQKKYHIFNQPYSKEDYQRELAKINLGSFSQIQEIKQKFAKFMADFSRLATYKNNCENCSGDRLNNCKNVHGFNVFNGEDCKFYYGGADSPRKSHDILVGGDHDWGYESMVPDHSFLACFTNYCWKSSNIFYSDNCHSCEFMFGCIGFRRAKYCILNKQYTEQEYEDLVPKIIEHMQKYREWGEYFPSSISPFGYNETVAQDHAPLTKETALAQGLKWQENLPFTIGQETISRDKIPDEIKDIKDSIGQEILACQKCQRNFRLIQMELDFYCKMKLPIPRLCPPCRRKIREKSVDSFKLYLRNCAKCKKEIEVRYSPDDLTKVECEDCYYKELY
ncbi:MAG: hypothetical protein NTZ80_01065 [Patescibacteria group bacterium]|nr:hypothetical protein [Patescibacteria group bacterium]